MDNRFRAQVLCPTPFESRPIFSEAGTSGTGGGREGRDGMLPR